jgi:restriction system protein
MDHDWSDFPLQSTFVGREQELDLLRRELLLPQPRAVCITGLGGMGKTALAMKFAYSNRESFPAGIYHVHATPFEPLPRTVAAHVSNPSSPYLLVVDEVEVRPIQQLHAELAEVRALHPSARVIYTSRLPLGDEGIDLNLQLRGFDRGAFDRLLHLLVSSGANFESSEELFDALSGHPMALRVVAGLMQSELLSPREIMLRLRDFSRSVVLGPDGKPIGVGSPTDKQIVIDVVSVSDQLIRKVHGNPKLLYQLTPRGFEEFVAEVLDRLGYTVTLTPASKDGGKDIYAARKDHLGSFLYVVECKKYAPDNPVGVGLIRQLSGVVHAEQATAGILATTSFFTKGAREFERRLAHQISLKDYFGLQEWLEAAIR